MFAPEKATLLSQLPIASEERLQREQEYNARTGRAEAASWCQEHYGRLPRQVQKAPSMINLWGLLNHPVTQAMDILFTRTMCVYDQISDVLVTCSIDRTSDPVWFAIGIFLQIFPLLLKFLLFRPALTRRVGSWGGNSFYGTLILGPFILIIVDFYLLICYPWTSPTDAYFLGTLERLSPLIETFIEGLSQSAFQLYMYARIQSLPDHEQYPPGFSLKLLVSLIPSVLNILYKIICLKGDARALGMSLPSYLKELANGPLGRSAPFVTLLNKREEIHYETMGRLRQHEDQIFRCLGKDNTKLSVLSFDELNDVSPVKLATAIEANEALTFVDFGVKDCSEETVYEVFSLLRARELEVGMLGQLWRRGDRETLLEELHRIRRASCAFGIEKTDFRDVSTLSQSVVSAGANFGFKPNPLSDQPAPGLVLWLDASATHTMKFQGSGDGDGDGLLEWQSLVRGPTMKAENKTPPPVGTLDGVRCVYFDQRHSMQMEYPLRRVGTIISVHCFGPCWCQYYIFTGVEQGPFHGDDMEGKAKGTKASLVSGHGAWVHRSPYNGRYRLGGGEWEPVKGERVNVYWQQMRMATLQCESAFHPGPRTMNRIGCDRGSIHQFKGYVSELLVFDSLLNEEQVSNVEQYLQEKWFPAGHPAIEMDQGPETPKGQSRFSRLADFFRR